MFTENLEQVKSKYVIPNGVSDVANSRGSVDLTEVLGLVETSRLDGCV